MKKSTLSSVLVAALTLVAAACGGRQEVAVVAPVAAPAQVERFNGHWEGAAQITSAIPNAPAEMDIVAVIGNQRSVECGTIEYSSIGCSGVWDCTTSPDGLVLTVRESIRFGAERCPPGANVELRATNDPNMMEFRYSSPAIQGQGTIHRRAVQ